MAEKQFDSREWDTLEERGVLLAGEGWRFTPSGGVRHLTHTNFFQQNIRQAPCGMSAHEHWWLGTGSQEEYEKLARLPKCLKCMRETK